MLDLGKVYVIQNRRSGLVKIGKSTNTEKRLKFLQNSCGEELELLYETIQLDNCGNIERKAHKIFKEDRRLGEWFNIVGFIAVREVKYLVAEEKQQKIRDGIPRLKRHKLRVNEVRIENNIHFNQRTQIYVVKLFKDGDLIKNNFKSIELARVFREQQKNIS